MASSIIVHNLNIRHADRYIGQFSLQIRTESYHIPEYSLLLYMKYDAISYYFPNLLFNYLVADPFIPDTQKTLLRLHMKCGCKRVRELIQ